jgi:hypothetical protein
MRFLAIDGVFIGKILQIQWYHPSLYSVHVTTYESEEKNEQS